MTDGRNYCVRVRGVYGNTVTAWAQRYGIVPSMLSPDYRDSDGDGFHDSTDSCPAIFNPGQEPWYCSS